MRTTLLVPFLGLALTAATPSQCLFTSVSAQPVGQGCNSGHTGLCMIPGFPSTLIPELDTTNCELDVTVTALVGCGGVTVPLRVLAVGFLPTFVPLSMFGSGCALQVDPIALLASTGPPGVPRNSTTTWVSPAVIPWPSSAMDP